MKEAGFLPRSPQHFRVHRRAGKRKTNSTLTETFVKHILTEDQHPNMQMILKSTIGKHTRWNTRTQWGRSPEDRLKPTRILNVKAMDFSVLIQGHSRE